MKHIPRRLLAGLLAATSVAATAQLAQEPLLNRPNTVPPNLLMIVDDSSSMGLAAIYEYGNYTASGPGGPSGNVSQIGPWSYSPDVNKLGYDPRVRYLPQPDDLGNPRPIGTAPSVYQVWFRKGAGPYVTGELKTVVDYHYPEYLPPPALVVPGSTAAYPTNLDFQGMPASTQFPKFVQRTDCTTSSTSCSLAEEQQNFLRWYQFYRTRRTMAQTGLALGMLDVPVDSVRLAYATLSDLITNGATQPHLARGMSSYSSVTKKSFYDWMRSIVFAGGTPSLRALSNSGRYFERSDSDGPWATKPNPDSVGLSTVSSPTGPGAAEATSDHASCRRSFTMLITDGYWNDVQAPSTGNRDGTSFTVPRDVGPPYKYDPAGPYKDAYSDTMADIAMDQWGRDLRTDLRNRVPTVTADGVVNESTWQNITFHAVTLGMVGSLPRTSKTLADLASGAVSWPQPVGNQITTIDDTWHATINGRGQFVNANNATELNNAIRRMMGSIAGTPQTLSGVAVSSTYIKNGSRKYKPEYLPGNWSGNLSAIELDPATGNDKVPIVPIWAVEKGVDVNGDPISLIPAPGSRNIVTWSGSAGIAFDSASTGLGADLVSYLRGDSSKELRKPGGTFRSRSAVLGDIVNSSPVFIKDNVDLGYENLVPALGDYRAFVASKAARSQGVLFVGANDGMLHAFAEADGKELFAYVPKAVVPELSKLSQTPFVHRYYVDGPNIETDAYLNGSWKNVLLGSTGAGAKAVYALNVTNTQNLGASSVLWEVSSSSPNFGHLGYVMSDVQAGQLRDSRWVAIFGNGYGGTDGYASLFVVDLASGARIAELATTAVGGNGLGGIRAVYDDQRRLIGAYGGDLKGNLWKFDLVNMSVGLAGNPLYAAGATQPITAPPAVLPHPSGGYVVSFGTGKFLESADVDETKFTQQRLYGIWDAQAFGTASAPAAAAVSGLGQLQRQTISTITVAGPPAATYSQVSTNTVAWGDGLGSGKRGWYIDLPNSGQRNVYPVERLPGTFVMASTLSPVSPVVTDVCTPSGAGSGWVYIIDGVTGSGPTKRVLDTNNDGFVNEADALVSGYSDPVDGRPTPIVLSVTQTKDVLCIETAQSTCTRVELQCGQVGAKACPPGPAINIKSREWRQLFMR